MTDDKSEILNFIKKLEKKIKELAKGKKSKKQQYVSEFYDILFGGYSKKNVYKNTLLFLLNGKKNIRFALNYRDYYLISLLAIEIKPKITLKAACDIDHPIAYEAGAASI